MTVLLLRLAAPWQSWGTSSRFSRRGTDRTPSKSGIVGLLAAAQGKLRTDVLEELLGLRIGVRTEQPGMVERDLHTAAEEGERIPISLSYRFYLADAVFLAAIEGEPGLLDGLADAIRGPVFPLYLGRRSCPPVGPVVIGPREGSVSDVLAAESWRASPLVMRAHRAPTVELFGVLDCDPEEPDGEQVRDEPISFDPRHRQWGWRSVRASRFPNIANPEFSDTHDPMAVM